MELAVDQLHFCNQQRNHFLAGPGLLFQGLGRDLFASVCRYTVEHKRLGSRSGHEPFDA
jgi:hypothetical protein